jgi:hypothetical protein
LPIVFSETVSACNPVSAVENDPIVLLPCNFVVELRLCRQCPAEKPQP